MAQEKRVVGLDVAKRKVEGCVRALGERRSVASTAAGRAELVGWLRANGIERAVMEASGGYERSWADALREAGLEVRVVDPKRVRHFAKAAGRLAKNDALDAEAIAWFAETFADDSARPHDRAREELAKLVAARTGFKKIEAQIGNVGEHRQPGIVAKAQAAMVRAVRAQIAKLDRAIAAKIKAKPAFAQRATIIASVPGLGAQTVAGLIAWLPELGQVSNQAAAALVGLAPYDDDSGERSGGRHIRGGRRKLRNLLYMPVMGAATRHNPVLAAHYRRLRAKGKEAKVALVACMRKLIVILNAMLARNQTWNPPAAALP